MEEFKYWKLMKQNKGFVLTKCVSEVKYSYSQIPLTEEEALNIINERYFTKKPDGTYWINGISNNIIERSAYATYLKMFNGKVAISKNTNEQFETVPNAKVKVDVPGTSKLLRSKYKDRIWIAYRKCRKDGYVEDYSTINSVLITNAVREEFFSDCKALHPNVYMLRQYEDPEMFKRWSEFMDQAYKMAKEQK